MPGKKLTELTQITTFGDDAKVYIVDPDRTAGDQSVGMDKDALAAALGTSSSATNPVENEYADITALLADQGNQTTNFFQYVLDASADPNITSGAAYYEKLATSTATLADDYRLLTDDEATVVEGSNAYRVFRISDVQDDATPLTSVSSGKIGFEYDNGTDLVTGILFNKAYTDVIEEFYGNDVNIKFYNQKSKKYEYTAIGSADWTTVGTHYAHVAVTDGNIDRNDLTVNDRVENFMDLGGAGASSSTLAYQTEITTNTTLTTQEGLNNVYPVNSASAVTITVPSGVYSENDVINFERRGQGSVEFVPSGTAWLRGRRDIDNRYFINDTNSIVSLLCRGSDEFTVIGDLTLGFTGVITTSSYSALQEGAVAVDVIVLGTGFSSNMKDPVISANATLNSWTYVSNTQIKLNLDAVGLENDTVTVTYDNGDILVDTDAITIGAVSLIPIGDLEVYMRFDNNLTDQTGNHTPSGIGHAFDTGIYSGFANESVKILSGDYVTIPDSVDLSYGNGTTDSPFSVTFAMNVTPNNGSRLFCKRGDGSVITGQVEYDCFLTDISGSLYIRFVLLDASSGDAIYVTGNTAISSGTNYHISVTYDGNSLNTGMNVYIDGVAETLTLASSGSYVAMENGTSVFVIGNNNWTSSQHCNGRIDGFGLWNKELSQAEVTAIYDEQILGNEIL